jgi:hypothetical protein
VTCLWLRIYSGIGAPTHRTVSGGRVSCVEGQAGQPAGIGKEPYDQSNRGVLTMGKYLLGWIFGVPVVVLVIIYLLFN